MRPAGRAHRALALLGAGALALGAGACGGSGAPGARSLLRETFESHRPIESGRMDLSVALTGVRSADSSAAGTVFSVHVSGPFQSLGAARLPRFALLIDVASAELGDHVHTLALGATSTGGQLFIALDGTQFLAPAAAVRALERGYAETTHSSRSGAASATFASLGVDPGEWLTSPTLVGSSTIGGEKAFHIVAGLSVPRFLADVQRLLGDGSAVGLTTGEGSALLSPTQISALSGSVRSGRVDVYTGASDHLLRRLSLSASISTGAQARSALDGLRAARLTLVLQLADLNRPQRIAAPGNPQPLTGIG